MKKKAITITEIAKLAGVSVGTVSKVCNGYGPLAKDTILKVQKVIEEHNYEPLPRKKSKRKSNNYSNTKKARISFLVPENFQGESTSQLTVSMTKGVSRSLAEVNSEMIFSQLTEDNKLPYSILQGNIDGIICKDLPKDENIINEIIKHPHVWCLATLKPPGLGDQVSSDSELLATIVLDYYSQKGFDSINVFVDLKNLPQRTRFMRLKSQADMRGIKVYNYDDTKIENLEISSNGKYAVIVDNAEFKLFKVYMLLKDLYIDINHDIECMCVNASKELLLSLDANFTRIDLALDEIGRAAGELLLWRLEHPTATAQRVLIAPKIISPA